MNHGSSQFVRWIVRKKQELYPELAELIEIESYPKHEKNPFLIKDYLEGKKDPKLTKQFDLAWTEYRLLPEIGVIVGFNGGSGRGRFD